MKPGLNNLKAVFCVVGVAAALLAGAVLAQEKSRPAASGFSFDVYGDSRSMMYLPYKQDQEAEARELMVDMFALVLPEKVSQEMVNKYVKLTYDPSNNELIQIVMPFMTASQVTTLKVDKGWVTEASVEDIKLLPGVSRTMFRLEGGDWVAREIVKDVKAGQAKFVLSTGDLIWWAKQGNKPSESPYWKLVNEDVLKQLPHPDKEMRAAGLDGRVFPAVGNHEVWGDTDVEGLLTYFPYLKKFGVSDKQLIYKFDFDGVRFIFLWTGKYDYRDPTGWVGTRPTYEEQMKQLKVWMDEAKTQGTKKVFIAFQNPAFARVQRPADLSPQCCVGAFDGGSGAFQVIRKSRHSGYPFGRRQTRPDYEHQAVGKMTLNELDNIVYCHSGIILAGRIFAPTSAFDLRRAPHFLRGLQKVQVLTLSLGQLAPPTEMVSVRDRAKTARLAA